MEKILYEKEDALLSEIFVPSDYRQRLFKAFLGRVRRCLFQEINGNPDKKLRRKNLLSICNDPLVQYAAQNFENRQICFSKRIMNVLIREKHVLLIQMVFKLKSK